MLCCNSRIHVFIPRFSGFFSRKIFTPVSFPFLNPKYFNPGFIPVHNLQYNDYPDYPGFIPVHRSLFNPIKFWTLGCVIPFWHDFGRVFFSNLTLASCAQYFKGQ